MVITGVGVLLVGTASVLGLTPAASAGALSAVTVVGGQGVGAGANDLLNPAQVALDSHGDLFVADNADRVVEYPLSAGTYATTGTVVAGLASPIDATGVALDAKGDLFVSDGTSNRVVEFPVASNGTYPATGVTVAGTGGQGSGATQLNGPTYLAVDSKGDLFVADTGNNRVQEFAWNASTASFAVSGTTVAGTGGAGSGSSQLSAPGPLALDAGGDLFVADNGNHRIQEFAVNAATGTYSATGTTAYTAAGIPVTFGQLAFDASGDLFLTWTYPQAEPVVELTPDAATGTYLAISITPTQVDPLGIAVDSSGDLFVSDGSLPDIPRGVPVNFVQELTPTSTAGTYSSAASLSQVGGTGVSPLSSPWGVAVDSQGDLFVANAASNNVLEFPLNASTGTYPATETIVAGAGGTGSGASQLDDPDALALDSHGDLFIADAGNNRVVEYIRNAATGGYSATGITVAGAGGTGSGASQLDWPNELALDSHGDLFIADEDNNRVVEYTLNTSTGAYSATGTTLATGNSSVDSVALDSHGDLFVGNPASNDVLEYPLSASTGSYPATGTVVARLGATGRGAIAAGPGTISVDSQGDIFAGGCDYTDDVVEFPVNTSTGQYPSTPTVLLSGPGAGASQVTFVCALALDTHGDLFIADEQNERIQELPAIAAAPPTASPTPTTPSPTPTTPSPTPTTPSPTPTTPSPTPTTPSPTPTTPSPTPTTPSPTATASANLIPDPGFEGPGVPADYWGSTLARSQAVVHSGSWSLAQTLTSSSGGWDLDDNSSWCAPISAGNSYTAGIWVYATAAVKVNLSLDLLTSSGGYVDSATGPNVTLTPDTWTHLTVTGIQPASGEVYGGMEPDFLKGTKGTIIYWDDMTLTSS